MRSLLKSYSKGPAFWLLLLSLGGALALQQGFRPHYFVEKLSLEVKKDKGGSLYYLKEGKAQYLNASALLPIDKSPLAPQAIQDLNAKKTEVLTELPDKQIVYEFIKQPQNEDSANRAKPQEHYSELILKKHYGIFSLWPAFVAIAFCWITHEPLAALFLASLSGALMLGHFDYLNAVLLPSFMSKNAVMVLVLYLWLLGGLLGVWSRTGAALAFANWTAKRFVRGPCSARLVAWFLGILFFQGGTISTVLVGTTVKPLTDKQKISHEELSYIVDSTASPIACLLAFNAWPAYIQAFLYLPGVAFLATEEARLAFFFKSLPFSFYAILAVLGTFLFCFDKLPFVGKGMQAARARARSKGQLDAPDARPMSAKELHEAQVPQGYKAHALEFILPLLLLLGIAVGSFILRGTPEVHLAFGLALAFAISSALLRGMRLQDLITGLGQGYKGVLMGALVLLLAITVGRVTQEAGGGIYLREVLGPHIPYFLLPALLAVLTIVIAFSTGTSWGTYAVVYPLAMPLAWAAGAELAHPVLFLSLCFAVVLNASVIGDQSSPISDTTILSSMCTGCDLMAHVRTQIIPVAWITFLCILLWTAVSLTL